MSDLMFSATEQVKLNNAVDEGVQSLMRQKASEMKEKNHRADIFEELKKEGVPVDKALLNALINQRFDGKSSDAIEKHEDIVAMEEILTNSAGKSVSDVASDGGSSQ